MFLVGRAVEWESGTCAQILGTSLRKTQNGNAKTRARIKDLLKCVASGVVKLLASFFACLVLTFRKRAYSVSVNGY
ncbi:MAG: hypothetical protein WC655_19920, partial [Candidatus Hydrogenedentales bacterium]